MSSVGGLFNATAHAVGLGELRVSLIDRDTDAPKLRAVPEDPLYRLLAAQLDLDLQIEAGTIHPSFEIKGRIDVWTYSNTRGEWVGVGVLTPNNLEAKTGASNSYSVNIDVDLPSDYLKQKGMTIRQVISATPKITFTFLGVRIVERKEKGVLEKFLQITIPKSMSLMGGKQMVEFKLSHQDQAWALEPVGLTSTVEEETQPAESFVPGQVSRLLPRIKITNIERSKKIPRPTYKYVPPDSRYVKSEMVDWTNWLKRKMNDDTERAEKREFDI